MDFGTILAGSSKRCPCDREMPASGVAGRFVFADVVPAELLERDPVDVFHGLRKGNFLFHETIILEREKTHDEEVEKEEE